MLNSFTRPKSWYMYSRQLSICSNKEKRVSHFRKHAVKMTESLTNLIVFPVPDIKCWLLQRLNSLLRQCVLYMGKKMNHQNISLCVCLSDTGTRDKSQMMYLWVVGDISSWSDLLPVIGEVVFAWAVYSEIRRKTFHFIWYDMILHDLFCTRFCYSFYLPPPLEVISSRSFFRSFLHFSISTTFKPSTEKVRDGLHSL